MNQFQAEWQAWHDERVLQLASPHGWLSLTGLRWLGRGENRFDGMLGTWTVADDAVTLILDRGQTAGPTAETLRLAGQAKEEGRSVDLDVQGGFRAWLRPGANLLWISSGTLVFELIRRGTTYGVRLRDSSSPLLRSFHGVPAFEPDESWVKAGVFTPHEQPAEHRIATAWPGLEDTVLSPGTVRFEHEGREVTLHATGSVQTGLTVLFSDASSGTLTPAWRMLSLGVPDAQGGVVLDFNRAVNMPFAFTPFATCPAPIAGNELPFAVWAGERKPAQTLGRSGVNCPVLVIRNEESLGLGELGAWWEEAGLDLVTVDLTAGERIPPLTGFKAVIVLGQAPGADACLEHERALLADALAEGVPTLGFGAAELLAGAADEAPGAGVPAEDQERRPEPRLVPPGEARRIAEFAWQIPAVPAISSSVEADSWKGFVRQFAQLARSGAA